MTNQEPGPRSVGHDQVCNQCGEAGIECKLIGSGESHSLEVQFQHSCGCMDRRVLSTRRFKPKTLTCSLCQFDHGKIIFNSASEELSWITRTLLALTGMMFLYFGLAPGKVAGMVLMSCISAPFFYLAYAGKIKFGAIYRNWTTLSILGCVFGLIGKLAVIGLILWALAASVFEWLAG